MSIHKILIKATNEIEVYVGKLIIENGNHQAQLATIALQESLRKKQEDLTRALSEIQIAEERVKALRKSADILNDQLTEEREERHLDSKKIASLKEQCDSFKCRVDYLESKVAVKA